MSLHVLRVYPEGGETGGHLPPDVIEALARLHEEAERVVHSVRGHLSLTIVAELDR